MTPKSLRVITNSERLAHACPRRWGYKYKERLSSPPSPRMGLGSAVHAALEAFYRESVLDFDAIAKDDNTEQVIGIMAHYAHHYAADLDRFEIVAIEAQVSRDLFDRDDKRVVYAGKVDGVVRDNETGLVWLLEHKTTSQQDLEAYCSKLNFDPQIRSYAWALANPNEHATIKEPINVAGVIYNVIFSSAPEPARILKSGKPSKDKSQNTTAEIYRDELEALHEDPADYQEILAALEARKWFHRSWYVIDERDHDDIGRDLVAAATRIVVDEASGYLPRQPAVCTGGRVYGCSYESVCMMDGPFTRADFQVRELTHPELDGDLRA